MKVWYLASTEDDQRIIDNHKSDLELVAKDEGEAWSKLENGKLAAILLTDQMTRQIFRKQGEAFSYDHIGLKMAKSVVDSGEYASLKYVEK